MKKKWGAFVYVPVLACLVAGGGAHIWNLDQEREENLPNQVYYLDEYFKVKEEHASDAQVVGEKDVILENFVENFDVSLESDVAELMDEEMHEGFILQLVDDHVLVFRLDDRSECYMSTGIRAEDLPEKTLKEIIEGKEILDEESLYFFLESYSS